MNMWTFIGMVYCSSVAKYGNDIKCKITHVLNFWPNRSPSSHMNYEFSTLCHLLACWVEACHITFWCIPLWFDLVTSYIKPSSCDQNAIIRPECNLTQCFYEGSKIIHLRWWLLYILCITIKTSIQHIEMKKKSTNVYACKQCTDSITREKKFSFFPWTKKRNILFSPLKLDKTNLCSKCEKFGFCCTAWCGWNIYWIQSSTTLNWIICLTYSATQ